MADSKVIWMDGELVPFEKASVHVLSHSLHYGSAAFEGIRAYKTHDGRTAIFRAREHYDRFLRSAAVFGGRIRFGAEDLIKATAAVIKGNDFDECYVRPIAYIGNETRGLKLPPDPPMSVAIATWKWGKYLGADSLSKGIKVHIASFRRPDPASSLPWAKLSGNYLNSIMARREATLNGKDEAILLDQQGFVAEGSGENIFVVRNGQIATPPLGSVLPGVTRDCIFEMAKRLQLPLVERPITRNELYVADEVFFTGTAAEVTPIAEIDGYQLGGGKPGVITRRFAEMYEKCTRGAAEGYAGWLTYV